MTRFSPARFPVPGLLLVVVVLLLLVSGAAAQCCYVQNNLSSDLPGTRVTNPLLLNPWGVAFSAKGPFWVSDNNSGWLSILERAGDETGGPANPFIVFVPAPPNSSNSFGTPTGMVFNGNGGFSVGSGSNAGSAFFIIDTEDGTISGFNGTSGSTLLAVDNSQPGGPDNSTLGAVYKGLAIATDATGNTFLYATNFRDATVEQYDANFTLVTPPGAFTDPSIPVGFAPFGIELINGELYVTYAMQDAAKHDPIKGPGLGFVDVYKLDGTLDFQLAANGPLNAPWGLAMVPSGFGTLTGKVLVGNFGDGWINSFDPGSKTHIGALLDESGNVIANPGLWALKFGNGFRAGHADGLYFTAGINDENDGLFGAIHFGTLHPHP